MNLRQYRKRIEAVMIAKCPRKVKDGKDAEGKEKVKLTPWIYVNGRQHKGAYELAFRVPAGMSYLDIERQVDAFYAATGAIVKVKDYAGVVELHIFPEDFPETIPYTEELLKEGGKQDILLGFNRQGEPIYHSLRVPHLLIAGKSGYGKTDLIRFILLQLIAKNTPGEIEIWIIDMKGFSFIPFKNIPHITRIARDLAGAASLLDLAVKRMNDRSNEVWESGDRNKAAGYKRLYVLIDEAYLISPKLEKDTDIRKIKQLADSAAAAISGTGREAGVGLFYCTQRPDSDVINPLVKANVDCKICFKTATESNSEIVLDRPDAAHLPHKKAGRILYDSDDLIELQVPFVGKDDKWEEVMKPYKVDAADRIGRMKANNEEGFYDDSEGASLDVSEGNPPIHDGASGEILFEEWQPVQEGERIAGETGEGGANRGEEKGNRQEQSLAAVIDWTKIFRS